jgi:hypothetical protein
MQTISIIKIYFKQGKILWGLLYTIFGFFIHMNLYMYCNDMLRENIEAVATHGHSTSNSNMYNSDRGARYTTQRFG